MRIVFHIDVNNAFLSWTAVKLLKEGKTDIRKIPSVIGGDETKRHGIVLAKSPVAKKMGITSAMPLYEAKKICNNLEIYRPDMEYYSESSNKFYEYLKKYSPEIERYSIDECFLELTNTKYLYDDYIALAYKIKDDIKNKFGFTVNVGIGNNKLCAKMASDFEKPDKVHTLMHDEIVTKMWPLPVEDLIYIGKQKAKKLKQMNINTISDLAHVSEKKLSKEFKNQAKQMKEYAQGIDNSKVAEQEEIKSVGREVTLKYNTSDEEKLKEEIYKQTDELARRLRKEKLYAKNIGLVYKDALFLSKTHQKELEYPTNSTKKIFINLIELFNKTYNKEPIRLIGIRLSHLTNKLEKQISIFEEEKEETNGIDNLIDNLNNKFGKTIISSATIKKIERGKNERNN